MRTTSKAALSVALRMAHHVCGQGGEGAPGDIDGWIVRAERWLSAKRSCATCDEHAWTSCAGELDSHYCESDLEFIFPGGGGCEFWSQKGTPFGR